MSTQSLIRSHMRNQKHTNLEFKKQKVTIKILKEHILIPYIYIHIYTYTSANIIGPSSIVYKNGYLWIISY